MKVDPVTITPLSERLQQAKQELGLSVRRAVAVAHKGGHDISTYTVTQCLNGKHGHVTPPTVEALAYAFQVPYKELAQLAGLAERHGAFRMEGKRAEYAEALTRTQAEAVTELMRLLAEGNRRQEAGATSPAPASETHSDVPLDPSTLDLAARQRSEDDPEDEQLPEH